MKTVFLFLILLFMVTASTQAQVRWKKKQTETQKELYLFHSTQSINFPTTETLKQGEFEYEIMHRFLPPIDTEKAFYGIDGPAHIRMSLSYAPTNSLLINLGRSNNQDNVDFHAKQKIFQLDNSTAPAVLAFRAGIAWVTDAKVQDRSTGDGKNFQYYGQIIANTMLFKKLGIGLVPSYLHNSHVQCEDTQYSFTMGSYLQYYVSPMWSLLFEMNNTISGWRNQYDSYSFGFELETGGHFFKIFLSNNAAINPSQFLSGADLKDKWRLGFNITRVLAF